MPQAQQQEEIRSWRISSKACLRQEGREVRRRVQERERRVHRREGWVRVREQGEGRYRLCGRMDAARMFSVVLFIQHKECDR